jgi:hypothetical protein
MRRQLTVIGLLVALPAVAGQIVDGAPAADLRNDVLRLRRFTATTFHDIILDCRRVPNGTLECANSHLLIERRPDGTCAFGRSEFTESYKLAVTGRWHRSEPMAGCTNLLLVTELAFDAEKRQWSRTQRQVDTGEPPWALAVQGGLNCKPDPLVTHIESPSAPSHEALKCTNARLITPTFPQVRPQDNQPEEPAPPPNLVLEQVAADRVEQRRMSCSTVRPPLLECSTYSISVERDSAGACWTSSSRGTMYLMETNGVQGRVWRFTGGWPCPQQVTSFALRLISGAGGWIMTRDTFEALHPTNRSGSCQDYPRDEFTQVPEARPLSLSPAIPCSAIRFGGNLN